MALMTGCVSNQEYKIRYIDNGSVRFILDSDNYNIGDTIETSHPDGLWAEKPRQATIIAK